MAENQVQKIMRLLSVDEATATQIYNQYFGVAGAGGASVPFGQALANFAKSPEGISAGIGVVGNVIGSLTRAGQRKNAEQAVQATEKDIEKYVNTIDINPLSEVAAMRNIVAADNKRAFKAIAERFGIDQPALALAENQAGASALKKAFLERQRESVNRQSDKKSQYLYTKYANRMRRLASLG